MSSFFLKVMPGFDLIWLDLHKILRGQKTLKCLNLRLWPSSFPFPLSPCLLGLRLMSNLVISNRTVQKIKCPGYSGNPMSISQHSLDCLLGSSFPSKLQLSTWHSQELSEVVWLVELSQSDRTWTCLWGVFIITNWYRRVQPTVGRNSPLHKGARKGVSNQGCKPVSNFPPWLPLQFLPEFLP